MDPGVGQPVHGRLRAKQLDVWAADFLNRHPNAVVLHLGAGWIAGCSVLVRRQRCSGSTWTMPDVIELRRRLYSVRRLSDDRVVGDRARPGSTIRRIVRSSSPKGLMYLTGRSPATAGHHRPVRHRRAAVDLLSQWASADLQAHRVGTRDGRELETSRLRYIEQTSAIAGFEKIPLKAQRAVFRMLGRIGYPRLRPALSPRFEFAG